MSSYSIMLVRNLRKLGDYQRAVLSQDENLRMAIANDRNIAQAKAQARMGMMPELTPQQQKSKEEQLTDMIAIKAKAQENLLTLYPKETVVKFMEGLTNDNMTYLNVYWNDLKPVFKNKTGLTKTYFDRILTQHIQNITDSRGMSTRQSNGWDSAGLNEMSELNDLGFKFLMTTPIIDTIVKELNFLARASASAESSKAARTRDNLLAFQGTLPTPLMLKKASELSEAQKQTFFKDLILAYRGMYTPNEEAWKTAAVGDKRQLQATVDKLFQPITEYKMGQLNKIYSVIGGRPKA
jgi:hypothetical protein